MEKKNEFEKCKLGPYGDSRDEIIVWWNEWKRTECTLDKKHLLIIGETEFFENVFVKNLAIEKEKILRTIVTTQHTNTSKANTMYTFLDPYMRNHHKLIIVSNFQPNSYDNKHLIDFLQESVRRKCSVTNYDVPMIFNIPYNHYPTRSMKKLESFFKFIYVNEKQKEFTEFKQSEQCNDCKEIVRASEIVTNLNEEKTFYFSNRCNLI